jgi:hypothetical protein
MAPRPHHGQAGSLAPQAPRIPAPADGQAAQRRPGPAHAAPSTADRGLSWLRGAMLALAVLAVAAAVVSWDAQYVLVRAVKHNPAVASLEAGIPDVGALIFATLGIALALHGKRAVRARTLNIACVGISLAMNALASAPGWRDLAITLIGVVRAWVIARARHTGQALADDEATPMALIGGAILWLVRLAVAPASTITGFRRWVIDECPVAPGRTAKTRRAARARRGMQARPAAAPAPSPGGRAQPGKQARLLTLAAERHDLKTIPLGSVSKIATGLAPEAGLSPGTARRVLLAHVRSVQSARTHSEESS